MAITMVGPFPGPFNRAHYSHSSSASLSDSSQGCPRASAPFQPQSRPQSATPERSSQLGPHNSVPYSPAQADSAASGPMYPPEFPYLPEEPESAPMQRRAALTKRRCYQLLCRLVAVGAATAVVALLVFALRSLGRVHPRAAPARGSNVVRRVNATRGNGTASPSTSSSATAEQEEKPGHRSDAIPGVLKETRRGHREVGEDRKAFPWPSSTRELAGPTTSESMARVAPRVPRLRGEDDSPAPALRATAATSAPEAATGIDTTAAALSATLTTVAMTRELAAGSSVDKPDAGGADSAVVLESGSASGTPGSPSVTSSPDWTPPSRSVVDSGSRPAATTATEDVAEVASRVEPDDDVQEV